MTRTGFKGFIFDMDGTLLHTLPDLAALTNIVLEREGYPARTEEEVRTFVGNGVLSLILQAVPEDISEEKAQHAFHLFCDLYDEYGIKLTKPFDGMEETLKTLKANGVKLGIMSNKFEQGVRDVEQCYFPGLFDVSHGESDTIPRKPDPTGLLTCAKEMGLKPEECVYFGDSHGDMLAGNNAGMYTVGVTWGYQPIEKIKTGNPDELIDSPAQILNFMQGSSQKASGVNCFQGAR